MAPEPPILKIAAMVDGRIMADGKPATIESLRISLQGLAKQNGVVWYYREAAQSEPPIQATEVLQAIIENRLPIRMSSLPDYSDSIGPNGKSFPISTEERFRRVREEAGRGHLVVVRPDGNYLLFPPVPRGTVTPEAIAALERIIPSTVKRNVAVIADNTWAQADSPDIRTANQAIPFFGVLTGLSSIGHLVWVFDGAEELFEFGCREADVLIVDSAQLSKLSAGWQARAVQVMRNPEIYVHDRASFKLKRWIRP